MGWLLAAFGWQMAFIATGGLGLVAGYRAACEEALWGCDSCREFQDLFNVLHQLERKAYSAIGKEHDAAQKWEHAKSEATFDKRLQQYQHPVRSDLGQRRYGRRAKCHGRVSTDRANRACQPQSDDQSRVDP